MSIQSQRTLSIMIAMQDHIAAEGVASLLKTNGEITVTRVPSDDDIAILQATEQAQPTVLILDDGGAPHRTLQLMARLKLNPGMRILLVSLEDNHAQLYERHDINLQTEADFLMAIHGSGHYDGL